MMSRILIVILVCHHRRSINNNYNSQNRGRYLKPESHHSHTLLFSPEGRNGKYVHRDRQTGKWYLVHSSSQYYILFRVTLTYA